VARCFPTEPEFADERRAERVVWEALRDQLPDDVALFHSVGLLEGDREQELDLLVAWPGVGLAVVEVKGGHVTRDADGWHQESKGVRRKIGSPVLQVQDGRHVLTRYLQQRAPAAAKSRTAHLIALPFTTVPASWEAPDCPRGMVVDRDDVRSAADRVKKAIEQHGAGHQPLGDVDALITALGAQMPGQTSLLSDAEEHQVRVDQMTRDQLRTLDRLKYHTRLKVIGGAGTGKTWLALEQAKRLARSGDRVALLCYSRGLARFFERVTSTWPKKEQPAYVGLFHRLPLDWGASEGTDDDSDYWERRLPLELGELARSQPKDQLFNHVVVDEAQDFGELWWPSLLACLRDPEKGGLFVFLDEGQRVFSRHGVAPIDLPPYVLDENIRNTKRIAQLFSSLVDEPIRLRGLEGAAVRLVDVPEADVIEAADDAVERLLDEGWEPGQIALLTTQHRHPEQKNAVDMGGWAAYWDAFFAEEDVFYGHVLGFKGLERQVVVLAVNGFRELERAKEMLYVGLSRARALLVLVGPRDLLETVGGGGVKKRLTAAQAWSP
jgi:hypothetical protein